MNRDDPTEPRGVVYDDPKRQTANSEQGSYPDSRDSERQTCQTCSRTVPTNQQQCEFCASKKISVQESSTDDTDRWTFGRVVLSVVEATTEYEASALGTAAFSLASDLVSDEYHDAQVKPVAAFETEPASILTEGWDDLAGVAAADSDGGRALIETAIEKTEQANQPHIYGEEGNAVTSDDEIKDLREQFDSGDEQLWLVPGIVERYESTQPDLPSAPKQWMECRECEVETEHRCTGKSTVQQNRGWPVWQCSDCHEPQFGYEPDNCPVDDVIEEFNKPKRETPAWKHQQEIDAYREEHGHNPWEDEK